MVRLAAILLLLWTLFLAPALCMGGYLEHACHCGMQEQCEHEGACATDPCADVVPNKNCDHFLADLVSRALVSLDFGELFAPPPPTAPPWFPAIAPPDRPRLAMAASDLPLRI